MFVDTSAYFAVAVPGDRDHEAAQTLWRRLAAGRYALYTTNLIIAETHVLLKSRLTRGSSRDHARTVARQVIEEIYRSVVTFVPLFPEDEQMALAILAQFSDQDFSFTDAASFAIMRRLGIQVAFAFDDDFITAGFIDIRHVLSR
jgi:predicted nucleic acid-binding protein